MNPKRRQLLFLAAVTGAVFVLAGVLMVMMPKPTPKVRALLKKDLNQEFVTVADVIETLSLDESKASYSDEPPLQLQALIWYKAKLPGTDAVVDITVYMAYTPELFSETRTWDAKVVRAARVTEISVEPVRRDK